MVGGGGLAIRCHREMEEVSSIHPVQKPDERWRFVDEHGHAHVWVDGELPTLEWVVTGTQWVGDDHDATEIDVGEYRCRHCSAVVEPKTTASYEAVRIPGVPSYTLVIMSGFGDSEYRIPDDDVEPLRHILERIFS